MTVAEVCEFIDHTLLKPEATQEDIKRLTSEAIKFSFWSCCVNPCWISLVKEELEGSPIKVCSVIGFPLGATTTDAKATEARTYAALGADELDMVINVGLLKSGRYQEVEDDIKAVVAAADGKIIKVILETGVLTKEEKIRACEITIKAGAHFVKTSTGFGTGSATIEDIKLMCSVVGPDFGVKASGGIRTWDQVIELIHAGASRIGTSASVQIIKSLK